MNYRGYTIQPADHEYGGVMFFPTQDGIQHDYDYETGYCGNVIYCSNEADARLEIDYLIAEKVDLKARVLTETKFGINITKFDCTKRAEKFAAHFKGIIQYFSKGEPYYENI